MRQYCSWCFFLWIKKTTGKDLDAFSRRTLSEQNAQLHMNPLRWALYGSISILIFRLCDNMFIWSAPIVTSVTTFNLCHPVHSRSFLTKLPTFLYALAFTRYFAQTHDHVDVFVDCVLWSFALLYFVFLVVLLSNEVLWAVVSVDYSMLWIEMHVHRSRWVVWQLWNERNASWCAWCDLCSKKASRAGPVHADWPVSNMRGNYL